MDFKNEDREMETLKAIQGQEEEWAGLHEAWKQRLLLDLKVALACDQVSMLQPP